MSDTQRQRSGSKPHKHTFHGLWYHLGPYGPQDVHVHLTGVKLEARWYRLDENQGWE